MNRIIIYFNLNVFTVRDECFSILHSYFCLSANRYESIQKRTLMHHAHIARSFTDYFGVDIYFILETAFVAAIFVHTFNYFSSRIHVCFALCGAEVARCNCVPQCEL